MHLIMLPAQTLGDPQTPPLLLVKDLQSLGVRVLEVVLGDSLEHILGEHDVAVLVVLVGIPVGVVLA